MKVKFIVIGKTSEAYLNQGISIYLNRIKHYADFNLVEIDEVKGSKKISMDEYRKRESEKLLPFLKSEVLVLLDEKGKSYTSMGFAKYLNHKMLHGLKSIDFVVGGPFGFDESIKSLAHESISLSDMTFSHQMIRLFFVEQIYRAFTIIKGEKYHHS